MAVTDQSTHTTTTPLFSSSPMLVAECLLASGPHAAAAWDMWWQQVQCALIGGRIDPWLADVSLFECVGRLGEVTQVQGCQTSRLLA
jgi:hypothetical protein